MNAKTTKKKATKKTSKALANQGRYNMTAGGPLAQAYPEVPLPDALKAFDAALSKAQDLRATIYNGLADELYANRARRLSGAASNLQHASWTLRESAYREADK